MVKRRFGIALLIAVAIIVLVVLAGLIAPTWLRAPWSANNDARIDQLRTLYAALREYKERTGAWPPDLESVRAGYMELLPKSGGLARQSPEEVSDADSPYVGFPPLSGPKRVEYFSPPLDSNVILRSYGHSRTRRGLTQGPVAAITMDVTVDGTVFLGSSRITEFQADTR